jgi:hypothetical protein
MSRTRALAALVAVALTSACGPGNPLKLDMHSVSISVPRLVTPAIELVPRSTAPQPVPLPPLPPVITPLPPVDSLPPAPPVTAPPACPKAKPFDVPDRPATQDVPKPPAPGVDIQTVTGAFSTTAVPRGALAGTVTVTTKALPTTTNQVGQQVDSWQVERTDAAAKSTSIEVYQLVHPGSGAANATAPGIWLVGLAWTDPVRGTVTIQPGGNGIEILPSPVQLAASGGVQYFGTITDPESLTTLTLTRNVTGRKRVDACGKLIDTFTVEMSGVLTTRDTQRQVTWTQQLATAFGGADVEETLSLSEPTGGFSWVRTVRNVALPREVA